MNKDINVLTDINNLSDKDKELLQIVAKKEFGTPKFKIDHFVGNAQFTTYAKFRQFLIELRSREEMLEDMELLSEKYQTQSELEQEMKDNAKSDIQKKLHDIEIRKNIQDKNRVLRRMDAAYKERQKYLDLINSMIDSGEAVLPDGRTMLEIYGNEEEEERLEKEYWTERLGRQAGLDMLSYGRIGAGNMEAILQLDSDHQYETMQYAISFSTKKQLEITSMQQRTLEIIQGSKENNQELESGNVFNFRK
jgi:hypothetical protein